jgi:hypothetical protein
MKTKASILCLLFVSVSTLSGIALASGDPAPANTVQKPAQKVDNVFRNFFIHREHNGVTLNWNVSSSSITSFVIQKSYDGEYFDDVDMDVRTVGRWSRTTDNDVYPGYIHYRVIAILSDGTECCSPVQVVRIVKKK